MPTLPRAMQANSGADGFDQASTPKNFGGGGLAAGAALAVIAKQAHAIATNNPTRPCITTGNTRARSPMRSWRRSVSPMTSHHGREREQQDAQVATQREILDVFALDGQPLVESQLAPAVNLHGSGQSGANVQPKALVRRVLLDDVDLLGSRPDHAHVTAQDIDELGQLLEARSAQDPADARHTRILAELERRRVGRAQDPDMRMAVLR